MKIPTTFTLEAETHDALRTTAIEIGAPFSALAGLLLKTGLLRTPRPQLEAWAKALKTTSKAPPRLRVSESRVLAALGPDWLAFDGVRAKALSGERITWRALQGLQAAGLVEGDELTAGVNVATKIAHGSRWRRTAQVTG